MGEIVKAGTDPTFAKKSGNYYTKDMKDYAFSMYLKGYTSPRRVRLLLAERYGNDVPSSRTIRTWVAGYPEQLKSAVVKFGDVDTLEALYEQRSDIMDRSDDFLRRTEPYINEIFDEDRFRDIPDIDKIKLYNKENHDRARLVNAQIQQKDPALAQMPPVMIFAQMAKAALVEKEKNGITATIIDVSPDEG